MLDLIILGIVPGTSFVITISWVLLAFLLMGLVITINYEVKQRRANHIYKHSYRRVAH